MDNQKNIRIILAENKESGLLLEDLLKDFSLKHKTELIQFEDENKLLNYLKSNKENLNDEYSHIIIFNLCTPLYNVIEVIKEIKSNPYLKFIPIFVVTSSIDKEEIREVYRAHANSFIVKPDDLKGLLNILDKFKKLWSYAELP